MNTIGKNIAERRRALGMTQETLAEKVGVSAQAVSKWENDMTEPDAEMLLTLADIFGATVDELLRGSIKPVIKENEDGIKPEDRILRINVVSDDVNVTVRIPAGLILSGNYSALGGVGDSIRSQLDSIINMIENNTVGSVVEVDNEGQHVTITIE